MHWGAYRRAPQAAAARARQGRVGASRARQTGGTEQRQSTRCVCRGRQQRYSCRRRLTTGTWPARARKCRIAGVSGAGGQGEQQARGQPGAAAGGQRPGREAHPPAPAHLRTARRRAPTTGPAACRAPAAPCAARPGRWGWGRRSERPGSAGGRGRGVHALRCANAVPRRTRRDVAHSSAPRHRPAQKLQRGAGAGASAAAARLKEALCSRKV